MKKVIERYKKFIFIYVLINLFALGINIIDLDIRSSTHDLEFYYLTNNDNLSNNVQHFWPFVNFIYRKNHFYNWANHNNDYTTFNGIFFSYDISEFIFYIAILFVFLFYRSYIQDKKAIPLQDAKNN